MAWTILLAGAFGLWLMSNMYSLCRNYVSARKVAAPIFIIPWNIYNPIWMVISVPLAPYLQKYLPAAWYRAVNMGIYGFEFRSKERVFGDKDNDVIVMVSSGPVEVSIRDPELATEILRRIKDFPGTEIAGVIMNMFGPNVLTSNGEDWSRQRKLIAPNINEKISKLVFGESINQAQQMLASYMEDFQGVTDDTMRGMKAIAINVLGIAGFGISRPWKKGEDEKPEAGFKLTYMDAVRTLVENIVEAAVMPTKLLTSPLFSPAWHAIGHAKVEFPIHTRRMLERERTRQNTSSETKSNLMSMIVRLVDEATAGDDNDTKGTIDDKSTKKSLSMSEEEILGNLFVFTGAGFDTTANTMAYALALLSTYPKWQDWLYKEISTVLLDKDTDSLEYNEIFPKLPRCLSLMYETLRLFPPLTHLARQTPKHQDVTVTTPGGKTYFFPRGTMVYINTVALSLDTRTWGEDVEVFRPSRWIIDPSAQPGSETATITNVKTTIRGTFLPWSAGPRTCPGMKMSQVEFVSVFMSIFGFYRCEAVKIRDDESDDQVRARFEAIMQDSQPKVTLQMMRNKDMKVKWTKR